eukprot:CAMPEP_0185295672 /NCGR_PEP_ID=MMETSP1363-20130426/8520_1 /TAXON_ID=38817 /ORGANISM="Gephyrocapsa oceanica, Strain RCC1303" /LENGTH=289 /DNA_ID=CAMNT_0027892247 /DNA_START=44 /DNA_END=913 /DNA_ORIENTATION=+
MLRALLAFLILFTEPLEAADRSRDDVEKANLLESLLAERASATGEVVCSQQEFKGGSCKLARIEINTNVVRSRRDSFLQRQCGSFSNGSRATLKDVWHALSAVHRRIASPSGQMEGHAPTYELEAWLNSPGEVNIRPKVICEVGMNGGHSAAAWLCAFPDARYIGFDLLKKRISQPSLAFLKQGFPGRVQVIAGDTTHTLPEVEQLSCDVLSVDGGHTHRVALSDLIHIRRLAAPRHALIMDDLRCPWWVCRDPSMAWSQLVRRGDVLEHKCEIIMGHAMGGYCVGAFA